MSEQTKCELCGEPMPPGETMFKFHGYSGPCPKPPVPRPESETTRVITAVINNLPPASREQCEELAEHIRHCVRQAGEPVGALAVALVGSEMEARA